MLFGEMFINYTATTTAMRLGNLTIDNPFVLAPMHELNYTPFRLLCKGNGAGLIYTQMYDTKAICSKSKEDIRKMLNIQKAEKPIVVQLIGSDIEEMKKAVELVEEYADAIDLNVGCIEKKYLERGCGAALLNDLPHLEKLIKAMKSSTSKPITAKIRIGWDAHSINGVKVAQSLEKAGVDLIAVHGRTAEQKYAGKSNWTIMKQIKEKLKIPVIANGDVKSYKQGLELMEKTGCDAVMIGREAKYKPWIFDKDLDENMDNEGIRKQILRFLELCEKFSYEFSLEYAKDQAFRMTRDFVTNKDKWQLKKSTCSIGEIKEFVEKL